MTATDTIDPAIDSELIEYKKQLDAARPYNIGSPGGMDYPKPSSELQPLLWYLLNNVGDLREDGIYPAHSKRFEKSVISFLANLFGAPSDHWGVLTPSGTDSNRIALHIARASLTAERPNTAPIAFYFSSAHVSVPLGLDSLQIPSICLRTNEPSDMADLADLSDQVARYRDRPVIVVATIGTTVTEAVDNVVAIADILRRVMVRPYWIHADAALSGIPLALLPGEGSTPFGFHDGFHSVCVSGHKFMAIPQVCSALLVRDGLQAAATHYVSYTGTHTTINTSRSGQPPLLWWYAIKHWGLDGLRERVRAARALATSTHHRLTTEVGGNWFYNPLGMTIVACDGLPPEITSKWHLADGVRTRLYTMPGVTESQLDEFVTDVKEYVRAR